MNATVWVPTEPRDVPASWLCPWRDDHTTGRHRFGRRVPFHRMRLWGDNHGSRGIEPALLIGYGARCSVCGEVFCFQALIPAYFVEHGTELDLSTQRGVIAVDPSTGEERHAIVSAEQVLEAMARVEAYMRKAKAVL